MARALKRDGSAQYLDELPTDPWISTHGSHSVKKASALALAASYLGATVDTMSGSKAGFDMTTQEGRDEFMMAFNASILQQPADGRFDLAEPPMQRIANPVKPRTPVMSASEKKAFDKRRKKRLAAKLRQKMQRK